MSEPEFLLSTETPIIGRIADPTYFLMDAHGRLLALCPQCQAEHGLTDIPDPYLLAVEKEAVEEGQVSGPDALRLVAAIRHLKGGPSCP